MGRRRPLFFPPILFSYRSSKEFANFLFLRQQQSLFPFLLDFPLITRGEPDIVASPTLFSPDVFLALGLGLTRCSRRLRGESLPGLLLSLDYFRVVSPSPGAFQTASGSRQRRRRRRTDGISLLFFSYLSSCFAPTLIFSASFCHPYSVAGCLVVVSS